MKATAIDTVDLALCLTAAQVAAELEITANNLYQLIHAGAIAPVARLHSGLYFERAEVDRYKGERRGVGKPRPECECTCHNTRRRPDYISRATGLCKRCRHRWALKPFVVPVESNDISS